MTFITQLPILYQSNGKKISFQRTLAWVVLVCWRSITTYHGLCTQNNSDHSLVVSGWEVQSSKHQLVQFLVMISVLFSFVMISTFPQCPPLWRRGVHYLMSPLLRRLTSLCQGSVVRFQSIFITSHGVLSSNIMIWLFFNRCFLVVGICSTESGSIIILLLGSSSSSSLCSPWSFKKA